MHVAVKKHTENIKGPEGFIPSFAHDHALLDSSCGRKSAIRGRAEEARELRKGESTKQNVAKDQSVFANSCGLNCISFARAAAAIADINGSSKNCSVEKAQAVFAKVCGAY